MCNCFKNPAPAGEEPPYTTSSLVNILGISELTNQMLELWDFILRHLWIYQWNALEFILNQKPFCQCSSLSLVSWLRCLKTANCIDQHLRAFEENGLILFLTPHIFSSIKVSVWIYIFLSDDLPWLSSYGLQRSFKVVLFVYKKLNRFSK